MWLAEASFSDILLHKKMHISVKRIILSAVIIMMIAFMFYACRKQTNSVVPDMGYAYYPYGIGKYAVYSLDSIIYNGYNSTVDTNQYLIKDTCVDTFTDNQGRLSYLIARYFWDSTLQTWQEGMDYYITPTAGSIELVENNLRYVKLVFPVIDNYSWNGNEYIDPDPDENLDYLNNWNYTYNNINEPNSVLSNTYDSTITVNEVDDSVDISAYAYRLYAKEVYAKNAGLIYQHFIYWQQQCVSYDQNGNCLGLGPQDGWEVIMQLMSHN
jgi:hypothetical protein